MDRRHGMRPSLYPRQERSLFDGRVALLSSGPIEQHAAPHVAMCGSSLQQRPCSRIETVTMPSPTSVLRGRKEKTATYKAALHQVVRRHVRQDHQLQLQGERQKQAARRTSVNDAGDSRRSLSAGDDRAIPGRALTNQCCDAPRQHSATMKRVAERDDARKALLEARRQNRDPTANENATAFLAEQERSIVALKAELLRCREMDKPALPDVFAGLLGQVRALQSNLTRAASFLPAYDIQKGQKDVAALEQTVRGAKTRLLPRKEFSFDRSRARQVLSAAPENGEAPEVVSLASDESEKTKCHEQVRLADLSSNFLHLENYCDSTLHVASGSLYALKLSRLERCTIVCGPVRGSVFVDQCRECVFVLCAAQLRIHNCEQSQFRIVVQSDPIIEDCAGVTFSPHYDCVPLGSAFPLPDVPNKWRNVRDFNCPIAGTSRNFELRE